MSDENEKQCDKSQKDSPGIIFAFLSFLLPYLGIILFGIWHVSKPQRANSCKNGALIGIFANLAVFIFSRIGFFSTLLIILLCLIIAIYRFYWVPRKGSDFRFLNARVSRFFPLVVVFSVVWILSMLSTGFWIAEFIRSGNIKSNLYYQYLWRMKPVDYVSFISIGALLVVTGCILLMKRRKNAVFVALGGGSIKVIGYLICGIFLKQNGSWGSNYGPVYLSMDDFAPFLFTDIAPGLILLPLLFFHIKKDK